ncbi:MAG: tetratricopeptide repeat protein [Candidatus Aureabacteria bacterium]|nr:tetratricopeptide repeat protein [Candidatus Auribacterota bacterium]
MGALSLIVFSCTAARVTWGEFSFDRAFKRATNANYFRRHDVALAFFQQALQMQPSSGQLKFHYGSTLIQLGRYTEGAAVLEESKKNFQDIFLLKNLGLAYERLGQPECAAAQYARWREMGIVSHEATNMMAMLRYRQGRTAEAEQLFRETLRVRRWDWTAHANLGAILLDAGRNDEAVAALDPGPVWMFPEAYTLYGVALLKKGRYGEAEENFRITLDRDPRSIKARNNLAALYQMTGKPGDAVREWGEVLKIDPENAIAKKNLEMATSAGLTCCSRSSASVTNAARSC